LALVVLLRLVVRVNGIEVLSAKEVAVAPITQSVVEAAVLTIPANGSEAMARVAAVEPYHKVVAVPCLVKETMVAQE